LKILDRYLVRQIVPPMLLALVGLTFVLMMPPIMQQFHQSHPNVLITLVSDTTLNLRSALREETIDLALLTESERGDRSQFLMTDRLVWIGLRGGEAHRRRPLSVALGRKNCMFRTAAIAAMKVHPRTKRPAAAR
jgi:DNA-binding transcriptional LysR family regulator